VRADGGDHECFLPSRLVHRYTGHTKGVQSVEFFPGTGHLLLSAGLDGRCKVWDAAGGGGAGGVRRGVRRTYLGHGGGVRQARFSGDGGRFASASFDRTAKVWDTETGACVVSLNAKGVAHCVTWAPRDDPNVLLVGSGNRKVMQWDLRAPGGGGGGRGAGGGGGAEGGGGGAARFLPSSVAATAEPSLLEYDMHYAPVNTVTFFDEGRKFVSTSDDKRLLVWEYGTPVPIKEIQDPSLHAISAAALHPGGGFLLGQSMDNTVVTYAVGDRVGRALKKTFKGHVGSGFACQPVVSPDGQFVGSGDGDGTLWFWAWGSTRVLKRIPRAHTDGPAVGLAWHPLLPASCATSGWDGVIALWE
jgi:pre-mRNA-processing factor 17